MCRRTYSNLQQGKPAGKRPPLAARLYGIIAVAAFVLVPRCCLAQAAAASTLKLFNGRAAVQAYERFRSKTRLSPTRFSAPEVDAAFVADNVKYETMDNLLLNPRRDESFFQDYRSFSQPQFAVAYTGRTTSDRGELYDDDELTGLAQGLFAYQSARTLVDVIQQSELEPVYRRLSKHVKQFVNWTTFQVVRGDRGSVGVHHGTKRNEDRILELRLHASARNGLEPRLRLKDNVMLRYDPLRGDTLLEYQCDF